jgi:uncharacterized phiE125 gp8 family phage protein
MSFVLPPIGWYYPLLRDPGRSIYSAPRYRMTLIRPPADLPVTLEEAIAHLRLDPAIAQSGPEAAMIAFYIRAATAAAENYASIAVMEQDWRLTMRSWPVAYGDPFELPRPPFAELLRIRINFVAQPLTDYHVETDERFPALLYPAERVWAQPTPREREGIIVEYRAGRADRDRVPAAIKQAILMAVASNYENRESLQQFQLYPVVELGWQSLLAPYREEGIAF